MAAFTAFLVSMLPYIAPIVATLLVYLAKLLTDAIAKNQNAGTAAKAMASFAAKAAMVVQATEQKNREAFAKACADGTLTKEEAGALAQLAVSTLLETATGDLDAMGIKDDSARARIAAAAVESEVYKLSRSNRIQQTTPATAPMEKLP